MRDNVDRGVALLDAIDPLWFQKIDPDLLDMDDCTKCCLGQMFGDYLEVARWLWSSNKYSWQWLNDEAASHGFALPMQTHRNHRTRIESEWAYLADLWRERIQARRAEFAAICQTAQPASSICEVVTP